MSYSQPNFVISSEERPPAESVEESLRLIDDLKFFLATAPANWQENQIIRRYYLNNQEGFISCVFWKNIYYITGTDIVRGISYKFKHFGRQILDQKKFEEGIFSDLRGLKCGTDAVLENPRSPFLNFLHKNQCLRTQKKQKVFFWFSVPHDKLFSDALERDLKRELDGKQNATTKLCFEPSLSFKYDTSRPLFDQVADHLESTRQEKGLNDYVSGEDEDDDDDDDEEEEEEEDTLEKHEASVINLETPINGATPLFVSDKMSTQELSISNLKQQENEEGDDDDDFPLDYFQVADSLSEQQEFLDPSVFFQYEMTQQPLLIEQSEKLIKSAAVAAAAAAAAMNNTGNSIYYPSQPQQKISTPQQQQQQQQLFQLLQQQQQQQHYYPYEEYPANIDYGIHATIPATSQDPYYMPYYQPYALPLPPPPPPPPHHLRAPPPHPPPPPPQPINNAFNAYYYDQQQQQLQLLRGFPSSQATLPPPSSVPQLGIFTNNFATLKKLVSPNLKMTSKNLKKKKSKDLKKQTLKKNVKVEENNEEDFNKFLITD